MHLSSRPLHPVLQAQLGAAEAREAALAREQEIMQGALTGQVAGVMDMMKGLRVSLSAKLSESQAVCQALARELAASKAKAAAYERYTNSTPCCPTVPAHLLPAASHLYFGLWCWQHVLEASV